MLTSKNPSRLTLIMPSQPSKHLPATPGYEAWQAAAAEGTTLDFKGCPGELIVIDAVGNFDINRPINICADASDLVVIRWDPNNQVKFSGGGGIIPTCGLTPDRLVHIAGDLNGSGGGSNPPGLPQCPQGKDGSCIPGSSNFNGGGWFVGYWLTTGKSAGGQTSTMSNVIWVGGWYSITTKFSMTSGTSGSYYPPGQYWTAPTPGPTTKPATTPPTATPNPPTRPPTAAPTNPPTLPPTPSPTTAPPTNPPTKPPTNPPTKPPTPPPTAASLTPLPTKAPTKAPTLPPTFPPTQSPTNPPTATPTPSPTNPPRTAAPIAAPEPVVVAAQTVAALSQVSGDPHFKTWTGEKFDYHGECDLVLVDHPEFDNGLGLKLHIRTTRVSYYSYMEEIALQIGDDVLQFTNDVEKFHINGQASCTTTEVC